jgi:hypothetical protein
MQLLRNLEFTLVNPMELMKSMKSFSTGFFLQDDMWMRIMKRELQI